MSTGMSELDMFLIKLGIQLKKEFTDEQKEFMSDFTAPTISFSSPGTGKTASAIGGLLTTELYHKVPGKNIFALSFTNAATGEFKNKYEDACKLLGVRPTVNFSTLHKLCSDILKANYQLLGMSNLQIDVNNSIYAYIDMLVDSQEELGFPINKYQARKILNAVQTLNSSLIFDQEHVESKAVFKDCNISFEEFTKVRRMLYDMSKLTEKIQVQDILLYTLELLIKNPEISATFKKACKVLVVDEFQDLSLLQLRIISLLSDNVVAIGDIKQQIYAFNGACQEIVQQFFKYFPNARRADLTKSFRCKDEIANYATHLVLPNRMGGEDFKGTGPGGACKILRDMNLANICDVIQEEFERNNKTFPKSKLFLFRNNYSSIPIVEELYKRNIPMRCNKYVPANRIPLIAELCELCELALNPTKLENIVALRYLIPEFKWYRAFTENPMYQAAVKSGCSIFEVNYQFRDEMIGSKAMNTLVEAREALKANKPCADVFNILWGMFKQMYAEDKEPYLENSMNYYISLVKPLIHDKTYTQFMKDEVQKMEILKKCEQVRRGVRCYTFHAAKGLEADHVYILSADEGVIPNTKKLEDFEKKGSVIEKAREIRNERSLVYVACTRAKEALYISYDDTLSSLFSGANTYEFYDNMYAQNNVVYKDVDAFEEFYNGK